ncbi:carbohydrate binding domain-containing protein [Ruminococcus flavefaciens]|uniref:carbohydrate binding domain-containing protein n=1 Tax=Ruminococcus flavefaciens TaxID=1265 RepID=UPI00048B6899|nr:carbohydrate binding domain-containing protein [Ruminococcus flavefaciens]
MKNYIDGFYELIHKNSLKRRRMISLLLVLSMFVSSGVLWGLHDTGITMVNEELCGIAEHTHTDECYEDVLICGLEENEEHTHTAECYEKRLVCGMEEHIHSLVCSGAEEDIAAEMEEADFAVSNVPEEFDTESEEEFFVTDMPELTLDNEIELMADGDLPPTISTIDNIAEGIKFTLFDYGDSNLESPNNNYGYRWDGDNNVWTHPNANTTDGINAGKNAEQDILFLAYGTPVDRYCGDPNVHNTNVPVYELDENGNQKLDNDGNPIVIGYRVTDYLPDKNSYSGDYNSNPMYSGNRPVSGIVDNTLYNNTENKNDPLNGYPTVNASEHHSLAYLFDESESDYKTVYTDVNHLLQRSGSHLIYNSNDNYAYFNTDTKEFDVYNKTYEIINDAHHRGGQTNPNKFNDDGTPYVYAADDTVDPGFMIGFFPFDQYDESRKDPNYNGNGFNHHFGMKMEAKFVNPSPENLESGEPVAFKYSGDDDMWVFVDGKLVLDIGGIHEPCGGMIDFTNGLVWIQDNELGKTMSEVEQDLINQNNGINTSADFNALPMPIGTDTSSTSQGSGNKWIVTPLTQYLGVDWDALVDGKKQTHEIKMFYLERGGCYSNLAMEMNLPTLKPLTVKKEVNYQDHLVKDTLIDDKEYEFQVWEWKDNEWVKPNLPGTNQGYFKIKDGDRMTFEDLEQHRKFKITEVNVDPNIYDEVSVNGGPATKLNRGGGLTEVSSSNEAVDLGTTNSYIFNNKVIQEKTSIRVKKNWIDPDNKKPADFTMKYKIMRTDSFDGEVKQVALKYEVEDPETHVMKVKKRRTFLLPPGKQLEGEQINDLLSRYGNHIYSYRVEELNVPMGFKASYSESTETVAGKEVKVLQVTNTDTTQTDIYVKKEWENQPDVLPDVKLVLRREKVGYHPSEKTNLKVKLIDEGGSLIRETTFNDVYANGSAEIICNLPEGVTLHKADEDFIPAIQKTPAQLGAKYEYDENILVVSNLAPKGNDPNAIANEVTLKIATYKAEDELLLIHHSFTRSDDGWGIQNDMSKQTEAARISPSNTYSYAKNDSLVVLNRSKSFNGATLTLDPAKFKANKTYTFSTYVYHEGSENVRFNFTFNDGLNKANYQSFHTISSKSVPPNEWTPLTGTVTLPDDIDPYNMFIIVETANPTNDSTASNYEAPLVSRFYMDEFTAIEGDRNVSVSRQTDTDPGGIVTIEGDKTSSTTTGNTVVYTYSFENPDSNGLGGGWTANDNGNNHNLKTAEPYDWDLRDGDHYVRVYERDHTDDGIKRGVSDILQKGHSYKFKLVVQREGVDSAPAEDIHLTLNVNGSGINWDGNEHNHYPWVCKANVSGSDYKVTTVTSDTVTIPSDVNLNQMSMYIGTSGTNPNGPFRVREITVYDVTSVTTQQTEYIENIPANRKDGYKIEDGKYVSDYSNYTVELDENSVTSPLRLDNNGEYSVDTDFSREILIPQGNLYEDEDGKKWGYHWTKQDLNEQNEVMYRYWIEEVKIGDDDISTQVKVAGDDKIVESTHEDYLISYDRQFVATNTENAPILVKNKYIWYKLPATGGRGTTGIYVLGGFLTAMGILSGCAAYKRKRRRD